LPDVKAWELVTPAERRLAILLFALAVLGQSARLGGRVSPAVARWLEGDPTPPAEPETTRVSKADTASLLPITISDTTRSPNKESSSRTVGDIDPNTADRATLMRLPGVGPVLADRILVDRARSGPYARPEDLLRVPGIGPAKLAKLRAHLVFGHARGG
jgi:competence protein ComEA